MKRTGTLYMTALAAAVAAVVAGCAGGTTVEGTPTSTATSQLDSLINNEQARVEPTTKPSAQAPRSVDDIAADVRVFWVISQELPEAADVKFVRSEGDIVCPKWDHVWSSTGVWCTDNLIMFSGPRVDALMAQMHGELATEIVLSHEFGHALQAITGSNLAGKDGDKILTNEFGEEQAGELSADCFAGIYLSSTDASSADIAEAIKLTKIGENEARISALNYGRSLGGEYAKKCLTTFGGKG